MYTTKTKNTLLFTALLLFEIPNWGFHASNYALANPIGGTTFLVDIWGLPTGTVLDNVTVGILINAMLGLMAVVVPIIMGLFFLEHHHDLFEDHTRFFANGFNKFVCGLILTTYGFVIATEFSCLYLRILEETHTGPIPDLGGEPTGFIPLLLMSCALILANLGLGLLVAYAHRNLSEQEV